jgi:hypothetical protein
MALSESEERQFTFSTPNSEPAPMALRSGTHSRVASEDAGPSGAEDDAKFDFRDPPVGKAMDLLNTLSGAEWSIRLGVGKYRRRERKPRNKEVALLYGCNSHRLPFPKPHAWSLWASAILGHKLDTCGFEC